MAVREDGTLHLEFTDQPGRACLMLSLEEEGPKLRLRDLEGKTTAILSVDKEAGPDLAFFDSVGNVIWGVPRDDDD